MITWQPIKVLYHRPEPEQSMATRWGCGLSLYWLHCPVYHTLILLSTLITTYFHSFSSSSFHHFTIFNISSTPSFWIRHSQKLLLGFVAPQFRAVAEILGMCPQSVSQVVNQHPRWFCVPPNENSGRKMEPKNCVAFRVDKVGSQEPALDLYCSKNKLIRGQQHPPYLLARTFLDLRNKTETWIAIRRLIFAKLCWWWWMPINLMEDTFFWRGWWLVAMVVEPSMVIDGM